MAIKYLCVYYDMIPAIETLSDAEAGRLLKGALRYGAFGESPDFSGNERFTWPLFMAQIDRASAEYQKRCEINRTNRHQSSRIVTNRHESSPIQDNTIQDNTIQDNKKRNSIKRKSAFVPPTLEEVEAFCRERNSSVNPRAFYEYFTADPEAQWVDSKGNPVRNWKQKIITWEGKGYGQRNNTDHAPKRTEEWNVHYDN